MNMLMVLMLDGYLEMDAHVRSDLCYLICSKHLFRSRAVTNLIFFLQMRPIFVHMCATRFEFLSNISTMSPLNFYYIKLEVVSILFIKGNADFDSTTYRIE